MLAFPTGPFSCAWRTHLPGFSESGLALVWPELGILADEAQAVPKVVLAHGMDLCRTPGRGESGSDVRAAGNGVCAEGMWRGGDEPA